MKLSEDLKWRGLLKDSTFTDPTWLDEPRTFYWGNDASSDSLTIGNLAAALLARRFVEAGWKAILLAGGATSLVGDPGGKDEERQLKSKQEIEANVAGVKAQIEKLFAGLPHETVNNLDWLGDIKYLDFLRDVGKNFSMSELLQREFVTARIGEDGSGISYAEFSYSLLQGYDFWWLFKNKGAVLQIGASDQWGNMLSGVPLIRKLEGKEAHAMSMPLIINKSTGVKFGKSEEGAVWLDPSRTSPAEFYQFWINAADDEVEDYLKVYTMLPRETIESVLAEHKSDPSARKAQKLLAEEVTKLVHGEDGLAAAREHAELLTSITTAAGQVTKLPSGTSVVDALVAAGLVSSNSEARRLLSEGGIYIDDRPAAVETLDAADFDGGRLRLRRGKKLQHSAVIELE